ncbi:hypothetical protein SEA_BILLNYE_218 [Streptomyces phage BillNye]|uniref:Uncharacterized protein n=2 Tax=Wilnyevirus billnye TaxID=2560486 RepID=A0A2L1IW09_9CAUD|nr:hypothetical protein FDJ30_gp044 [Streptomyces phage BillNye]AVD99389.1 hypothetical protein SEA_BILLNYE_218 [Streptomyces phage BillNye]QBZ72471.1 hypothetical protein SEA_CIRCINUS_218 [Streptomyces phage Circinus]
MRFEIKEETYKHGRKTEKQFAIFDKFKGEVVVRYAERKKCQELIDKYEAAQAAAEK